MKSFFLLCCNYYNSVSWPLIKKLHKLKYFRKQFLCPMLTHTHTRARAHTHIIKVSRENRTGTQQMTFSVADSVLLGVILKGGESPRKFPMNGEPTSSFFTRLTPES